MWVAWGIGLRSLGGDQNALLTRWFWCAVCDMTRNKRSLGCACHDETAASNQSEGARFEAGTASRRDTTRRVRATYIVPWENRCHTFGVLFMASPQPSHTVHLSQERQHMRYSLPCTSLASLCWLSCGCGPLFVAFHHHTHTDMHKHRLCSSSLHYVQPHHVAFFVLSPCVLRVYDHSCSLRIRCTCVRVCSCVLSLSAFCCLVLCMAVRWFWLQVVARFALSASHWPFQLDTGTMARSFCRDMTPRFFDICREDISDIARLSAGGISILLQKENNRGLPLFERERAAARERSVGRLPLLF